MYLGNLLHVGVKWLHILGIDHSIFDSFFIFNGDAILGSGLLPADKLVRKNLKRGSIIYKILNKKC
jgi:hypothetical protein